MSKGQSTISCFWNPYRKLVEVIEVKETSALSPVSVPLSAASLRIVHVLVVVFFVVSWSIETGRPEFAKV